jgi:lysophospholipase L1-like esterase
MRRAAASLLLAMLGLAVGLAAAELALRVSSFWLPSAGLRGLHVVRPDRAWVYGLRPGAEVRLEVSGPVAYRVNADGFRGRVYERPKAPDTFRIVVLGDSLAFGYGVAEGDSFPEALEALLEERIASPALEVVNLGVGGYNPYNEAALFADVGGSYQPDLVLVQFCINDLNDPRLHFDASTRLRLGAIPDAAFPDPSQRGQAPPHAMRFDSLCRSLRLCGLLDDSLLAWQARAPDAEALRLAMVPFEALPSGPERRWIAALYREIAERSAALGAGFAVVAFPHRGQLEEGAQARIQAQLVELGREQGWSTLDLLPAFRRAAAEGEGPLFLDLWHPSAVGHRVAAEAIAAELARRGMLPGRGLARE